MEEDKPSDPMPFLLSRIPSAKHILQKVLATVDKLMQKRVEISTSIMLVSLRKEQMMALMIIMLFLMILESLRMR